MYLGGIHTVWESSAKAIQIMGVDYVTLEEFAGWGGGEKSALDHLYEEHAKEKRELTPSKGVVC